MRTNRTRGPSQLRKFRTGSSGGALARLRIERPRKLRRIRIRFFVQTAIAPSDPTPSTSTLPVCEAYLFLLQMASITALRQRVLELTSARTTSSVSSTGVCGTSRTWIFRSPFSYTPERFLALFRIAMWTASPVKYDTFYAHAYSPYPTLFACDTSGCTTSQVDHMGAEYLEKLPRVLLRILPKARTTTSNRATYSKFSQAKSARKPRLQGRCLEGIASSDGTEQALTSACSSR
jgi:hypothetical protein